jgi:signal peptidase II
MPTETTPFAPRKSRPLLIMLASLVVYTALDLGSKEWALDHLSRERPGEKPALCVPSPEGHTPYQRLPLAPRPLVEGVLKLNYAENCGAAFSMLRTAPAALRATVFGVATLAALAVLMVMFVRGTGGVAFVAAVPLIAAGAIGNLSDRVRHGFVVDFFQVDPRLFNYPVFNVADIWIAVGVGLLLLDNLGKSRNQSAELRSARADA